MKQNIFILAIVVLVISINACKTDSDQKEGQPDKQATTNKDDTLNRLNQAIEASPDSGNLYNARAKYYLDHKQINNALRDINKAIQADKNEATYYVTLGDIYLEMVNLERSREMYDKAARLDDSVPGSFLGMARVHMILEEYDRAFNILDRLLDKNKHPQAYFLKAIAYEEQNDTAKAVKNLELAVAHDKKFYDAYKELGILLSEQNDPRAARYFKKAIELKPGIKELHYLLGLHYQKLGKYDKAFLHYDTLLMRNPNYKYAHYNKGYINLVYEEDFEEAIEHFRKAIQVDPQYADAYYNRGYAYELLGELDKASRDYNKTLKIATNHQKAIEGLNRLDRKRQN
ncbi:MAG: tetratricopeptide repeat protein [Bacteroidales bacterium]|nr:tetratricopeptide repeat protein [Bacteroidales bacterium]